MTSESAAGGRAQGITPLKSPANLAPYVIYGWLALGIGVLIYFLATDRSRIARTGLVFEQPEVGTPPEQPAKATVHHGGPRRPGP